MYSLLQKFRATPAYSIFFVKFLPGPQTLLKLPLAVIALLPTALHDDFLCYVSLCVIAKNLTKNYNGGGSKLLQETVYMCICSPVLFAFNRNGLCQVSNYIMSSIINCDTNVFIYKF